MENDKPGTPATSDWGVNSTPSHCSLPLPFPLPPTWIHRVLVDSRSHGAGRLHSSSGDSHSDGEGDPCAGRARRGCAQGCTQYPQAREGASPAKLAYSLRLTFSYRV
jgi:hypothetical protein